MRRPQFPPSVIFERQRKGQIAFRKMISDWMLASHTSLRVLSELGELAMTDQTVPGLAIGNPDRAYKEGDLIHDGRGRCWCALKDGARVKGGDGGPFGVHQLSYPMYGKKPADWRDEGLVRQIQRTTVNNLTLGRSQEVNGSLLDAMGVLNEWAAELTPSKVAKKPERLQASLLKLRLLLDLDGIYGPEELLSIYLGRMEPPNVKTMPSVAEWIDMHIDLRNEKATRVTEGVLQS